MSKIQYPFKTDHDIIVALIQDFNNSVDQIEKKIQEDHAATNDVKSFLEQNYRDLQGRVETVEKEIQTIDPKAIAQLKTDVAKSNQWIHDFNTKKHFAWVIASTGFLLIGYYIPVFIRTLQSIFLPK